MAIKINETFRVGTLYNCETIYDNIEVNRLIPMWRQTFTACRILEILQDIHQFNITYVIQELQFNAIAIGRGGPPYPWNNSAIDIYLMPNNLRMSFLDHIYPVHSISRWSFGFLLRRPNEASCIRMFYSRPFSRPLWNCLYFMAFMMTLILYLMKRWEHRLVGGVCEPGITYEMLMVIGAYCQHIPPLSAVIASRRTAYFIFFMFAYVIYCFYTSNLLSHLVNDRVHDMDLDGLVDSDYEFVIVDTLKMTNIIATTKFGNMSKLEERLLNMRSMSVPEGVNGILIGKIALLSNYIGLYPFLKKHLDINELCSLITVDLITNVQKYFFTSKNFTYKEHFKISTLWVNEVGLMKNLVYNAATDYTPADCGMIYHFQTPFLQISIPVYILLCAYVISFLILVAERIHFKRNQLWPYVE